MKIINKNWILFLLFNVSIVIFIINIIISSPKKIVCEKDINTEYYKKITKIKITKKSEQIESKYISDNEDILNSEEILEKENEYNTKISDNELIATKRISIKNYLKAINRYKSENYKCN